ALANDSLRNSNSELENALDAKTRFLATTSHEIRTPLNGILGMTEVLLGDDRLQDMHRDRIRTVHNAGTTMKALVDDILDVAKLETGKIEMQPEIVRIRQLLESTVDLWRAEVAARNFALESDLTGCQDLIICDPRRVRQIAFNLLSNAIKFTNSGRVSMIASTGEGRLHLRVSDTGIGIPQEHLDSVFNSFHQVDNSTTRKFGGTGLGLAICRNLAQAMGGTIVVESIEGVGSTFTLEIPLLQESDLQTHIEPALDCHSSRQVTILACEDNILARSMISAVFAAEGSLVIYSDPDSLTSQAKTVGLVAAVLDAESMGGIETATVLVKEIRILCPQLPIIILARADAVLNHGQSLRDAGADQVLSRPLPPPALVAAVRALVPALTGITPEAERAAA
ncbi:MAG: hypothetical protein RL367_1306, partial [Pseudomonadota bacterium]